MRIPFALFLHFCAICGGGVFAQKIREFVAPPPIRNVTVKATTKNDGRSGGVFDDPRKVSEGKKTEKNGKMPATNTVTSSTTMPPIKKTVIRNDTVVPSTTSKTTVVTPVTITPTKGKGTHEAEGAGELVIPLNLNTERTEANEGRNVAGGGENVHKTTSSGRTKLETTTEKGRKEEGKKERKLEEKKEEKEAKGGGKREERKEEKKEEKGERKVEEKEVKGGGKREERKEEKKEKTEEDKIGKKEEKKEERKVEEKKEEKEAKRGGKGEERKEENKEERKVEEKKRGGERKVEEKKEEKGERKEKNEEKGGKKAEKKEKEEERMDEKRKETEENVSTTVATSVVGMTGGGFVSTTIVSGTDQNGGGRETEGETETVGVGGEEETEISENGGDELSVSSTTPKSVVVVPSIELPPPTNEHCTDAHEYCRFWARNGFCTNTFYTREQIAQFCRRTCALC